jgi:hypothetical protein
MVVEYKGQRFLTDDDLKVSVLGFWPRIDIKSRELREGFRGKYGRDFLGGDEIIAYAQSLVSGGMDFDSLEEEILADSKNPEQKLKETIFKKTATGIGRGHSLGGLSGIVLGLNGTKMIDSGLTGFVASRSLVTSSRRREATTEEIILPRNLYLRAELADEYLQISRDVFNASKEFKDKFGRLKGIESFNKITPYNSPADLFIVMPLDTIATLAFEVRQEETNYENFLPIELIDLSKSLYGIAERTGLDTMLRQRVEVPRDTYLHYTVFKNPALPNYALELAEMNKMSIEPKVHNFHFDWNSNGFWAGLEQVKRMLEETRKVNNPELLAAKSMENMLALRTLVNEYNNAVGVKVVDTLSWRVWSEQKRHATLRQNVESVYSAAERAYQTVRAMWPFIQKANETGNSGKLDLGKIEKAVVIDEKIKNQPELLIPYLYHTARQLMFYGKLLERGIPQRDALYIVPRSIRLRTVEDYDLINLIDLELPLRLCSTCEPERYATSWKKREVIAKAIPRLRDFLQPKCNIGFCTEGSFCKHITDLREYNNELHKQVKQEMLNKARES